MVSSLLGEPAGPWWDPLGLWQRTPFGGADLLAASAHGLPGSWNVPQAFFDLLRSRLIGRAVSFGEDQDTVAFTLTSLEATVGQAAAVSGQADDVSLRADHVTWRSVRFERVSVRLGNYHTRLRSRPVVVTAPIDVSAALTGEALGAVLLRVAPSWCCEIAGDGDLRLRRSRRPDWGYVRVVPEVESGALVLRPRALGLGRHSWRLPGWLVPLRHRLSLPDHVRLTGVDVAAGEVVVHLRIDEWTVDVLSLLSWARRPG